MLHIDRSNAFSFFRNALEATRTLLGLYGRTSTDSQKQKQSASTDTWPDRKKEEAKAAEEGLKAKRIKKGSNSCSEAVDADDSFLSSQAGGVETQTGKSGPSDNPPEDAPPLPPPSSHSTLGNVFAQAFPLISAENAYRSDCLTNLSVTFAIILFNMAIDSSASHGKRTRRGAHDNDGDIHLRSIHQPENADDDSFL